VELDRVCPVVVGRRCAYSGAYHRPGDEYAATYLLSTLAIGRHAADGQPVGFGQVALPLYILLVNTVILTVIRIRRTRLTASTMDGVPA
jgi:hypothetical protein